MKICECGHDESTHHHGSCGHRACHISGDCHGWVEDWRPCMELLEKQVGELQAYLSRSLKLPEGAAINFTVGK